MKHTFEIYMDDNGEWRWRLRYRGDIIADSGEGYGRKQDVKRALRGMALKVLFAPIKVLP